MELGSNTGFVITDAGNAAATVASPQGPLVFITQFKVSDAVNFLPDGTETALPGNLLYTGTVSNYYKVSYDTIELILFMDATVGPFLFGSIGIYLEDGTLFALCSYEDLQQKGRAIGVQAGIQWRIRARLKFARASVVCQVAVITTDAILEIASWDLLATPANQVGNSNMAIVHEATPYDSSVLVFKNDENSWAVNDFETIFEGNTTDVGASINTGSVVHPGLAAFDFDLPQTVSKYLIVFPDGDIRKVTSQSNPNSLLFSPAKAVPLTGKFSILEDATSVGSKVRWADRYEYNAFLASFNPIWSTPSGTYPASNEGLNQTALATLNAPSHPTRANWTALHDAVIAKCKLHNVAYDGLLYLDYTYSYSNADGFGLKTIRDKFQVLLDTIAPLTANRNVSVDAFLESVKPVGGAITEIDQWTGTLTHTLTLAYASPDAFKALVNGGHKVVLDANVATGSDSNWSALKSFLLSIGNVTISRGTTAASGAGSGSSLGLYSLVSTNQQLFTYASGNFTYQVLGRHEGEIVTLTINVIDTAASGTATDLFTSECTVYRPTSTLFNKPVLLYPVLGSAMAITASPTPAPTPSPTPSPTPAPATWHVTPSTANLSFKEADSVSGMTIAVVSGGTPASVTYVSGSLGEFAGSISYSGNNVVITGTAGSAGSYSITHALTDTLGNVVNLTTNLTIQQWQVSPTVANFQVDAGQAVSGYPIATVSGGTPDTVTYVSGSLGEFGGGVSYSGNNVVVSGTAGMGSGSYSITHALRDTHGSVVNLTTNLTVIAFTVSPTSWSTSLNEGQALSGVIATVNGGSPSGSPQWMSGDPGFSGSIGYSGMNVVISGTATTTPGSYSATYRLTSTNGATTTFTTNLTVVAWSVSPTSYSTSLPRNQSLTTTIGTVSGGTPSGSPTYQSGDPGFAGSISYSGNNVVISGTSSASPGTYTATYLLTSTSGATCTISTTLTVT